MTAYPYRMRRSGRPGPGARTAVVMLLLLLAAVALFPAGHDHHLAAAHSHHLTASACVTPHHHAGQPVPEHGHRHEADVVSSLTPRSRVVLPDTVVSVAAVCAGGTAQSVASPGGTPPPVPPDVDLSLLSVLRV
jgi:hypothetical protein